MSNDHATRYRYEPKRDASGRPIKHKWAEPRADFRYGPDGHPEGMCPSTLSVDLAENLLNEGFPYSPQGWTKAHPKYIYNVHEGVVFKAVETNPGRSYHGFPCPGPKTHPRKPDMTEKTKRALLELADQKGCRQEVETWFREHP